MVTGCAGFIGSNLVDRLLADGFEVTGVDCFTEYYPKEVKQSNIKNALKSSRFSLIEADVCDLNEMPEVDIVFHLAGQGGVRDSWGEKFPEYLKNNVLSTKRLLELCGGMEKKVKIIYSSSSSVYGYASLPFNEDCKRNPLSPYAMTKLAGEQLCRLYHQAYGVDTTILRYFTVYGPRQRPDMALTKFISKAIKGEKIEVYGDGKQTRDFTHVSDVVEGTIKAAKLSRGFDVFNIGGGRNIKVNEIIKMIQDEFPELDVVHYSKMEGDVKHTLADLTKANEKLGYKPKIKFEGGVKDLIKNPLRMEGR